MLSSDQEARIRFAYRVWSTGNTYGAPAAAVRAANELSNKVLEDCGNPPTIDLLLFTSSAKEILLKSEN